MNHMTFTNPILDTAIVVARATPRIVRNIVRNVFASDDARARDAAKSIRSLVRIVTRAQLRELCARASVLLSRNGGYTIAHDGTPVKDGYAVSIHGYEVKYGVRNGDSLRALVYSALPNYYYYVKLYGIPHACYGAWRDGDVVYFDVSFVFQDENVARNFAIANKQLAYFNLATFETIRLD